MAKSVQDIVNAVIDQLHALDPSFSADIQTPERKIIEAVSEPIAQASSDIEVLDSQHDIDTMVGNRLDNFLANFGYGRQQPTRATGTATFSRLTSADADITIPRGTQVVARQASLGFASIVFATTETAVLPLGSLSVDAQIEAALPGTVANLPANSINGFGSPQPVVGISGVTNSTPTTGGLDGETDDQFRIRFKNTVFRNISGTTDQALANAVSQPGISKANVVGPISRYQEYIQVPEVDDTSSLQRNAVIDPTGLRYPHKRTTAASTIPYSKFTYDNSYYVSNGDFGGDIIFYRPNVDFIFNNPMWGAGDSEGFTSGVSDHQPNITLLSPNLSGDGTGIEPLDILLFEHAYISRNSRNDFYNGILNCVDVFVDGQADTPVISLEVMPESSYNFQGDSPNSLTYLGNFRRALDNTTPAPNNRLQVLFWQPVTSVPDTIQIGSNLYYLAKYVLYNLDGSIQGYYADSAFVQPAHYWLVLDTTEIYGTVRARNGIEWSSTQVGVPLDVTSDEPQGIPVTPTTWDGTQFRVENYTYDSNIANLQVILEQNKQTTTDVLAHQARTRYFKLYITIMYSAGVTVDTVNQEIATQLSSFFEQQYFGTVIQMSDLLQVIHNTPGVDNVRWSSDLDLTLPKVAEVQANGSPLYTLNEFDELIPVQYSSDFFLQDSELPSIPAITNNDVSSALVIKKRAQNTWNRNG